MCTEMGVRCVWSDPTDKRSVTVGTCRHIQSAHSGRRRARCVTPASSHRAGPQARRSRHSARPAAQQPPYNTTHHGGAYTSHKAISIGLCIHVLQMLWATTGTRWPRRSTPAATVPETGALACAGLRRFCAVVTRARLAWQVAVWYT